MKHTQYVDCESYGLPARDTVQFVRQVTTWLSAVNISTNIERHMTKDSPVRRLALSVIQRVSNPFI